MKLKNLPSEEALKYALASDKLRERFNDYVQECEMDYISEILSCFNYRSANWSIGLYNQNYFHCEQADELVYCARKMVNCFGASAKTEKALKHAEKLIGTNLFEYHANKLANCIEADLCEICDGIDDVCYDIYCREVTPTLCDYWETFASVAIDEVTIEEDGTLCERVFL